MSYCFGSGSAQSQTGKQEHKLSKTEGTTPGSLNISHGQTDLSVKPDNVKIKGLQANVSIPKVTAMTPNNERPAAFLRLWSDQGRPKSQHRINSFALDHLTFQQWIYSTHIIM